ncbi:GNAT family N-acetyltransferase [Acetobacter tropicalis]|mgnify:FL=1|uniref:L-ornithine N(alpha)-acyltransferase n=3 Tax=Acetobacter TaxID=434 RepID=A0A0U5EW90_9PROT|nr:MULTISPECIES: GNAT family N-acyltransferase [Acetobacter]ATJ89740.1 GNAT family N-acetyltransferase [Acetobacter tropicalis]KXV59786.1 hemolysin-like protein [Acetobacter senegalensis]MCC6105770.1 GNAT family N-acetyltransferase [Acetobacter sp.]MCG4254745.1 GNAT family N-acetyltransferase [Acetobacter senegalensis]MCG4257338.1 GNAT family N-acetyltransferase [Acetobacter senegalensis]
MSAAQQPPAGSLSTLDLERNGFPELRGGNLSVRIAATEAERDAAQALRYRVFYEEMGAHPSPETLRLKRDIDEFDEVADHLLVIDNAIASDARGVVGTYRLVQSDAAAKIGHFYSSSEYDISALTEFPGRLLEVGRSCVDKNYRGRAAMQLLWRGIASYIFLHRIDVLFGCASLPGTNPDDLADELTYLYHNHLAPPALRVKALPERKVEMLRVDPHALDYRKCLARLPPLIKGYLRLGGYVGDGAVIDPQFNTTDVAVLVKSELMADKYYRHYERRLRDALD